MSEISLWLANCYFAHNSLRFPALLPFWDAPPDRSFRKDQLLNANHFLLTFGFRGMVINDSQRSSDTVA